MCDCEVGSAVRMLRVKASKFRTLVRLLLNQTGIQKVV